ncbi:MAG: patatin-like phospholipase family protein [bacterium]
MKLGLALGGGGVRGLAHIGVVGALQEAGIPIHYLAGTSMGAVVGGIIAVGTDWREAKAWVENTNWDELIRFSAIEAEEMDALSRILAPLKRFLGLQYFIMENVFRMGIEEGRRVESLLRVLTQNKTFEETKIPLKVTSTDLIRYEEVVLDRGKLHQAIRASIAFPGVFMPVKYDGRILVDGGLVDQVPVRVVRGMGADRVIAVDVSPPQGTISIQNGIEVLLHASNVPMHILKEQQLREADLTIRPDFGGEIGTFDFSKASLCVEAGLRAGREAIPDVKRITKRKGVLELLKITHIF